MSAGSLAGPPVTNYGDGASYRPLVGLDAADSSRGLHYSYGHTSKYEPSRRTHAVESSAGAAHDRSRQSSRKPTPPSASSRSSNNPTTTAISAGLLSSRDAAMVVHSLEIPACITPDGGNLAEFTANITCLLWFETLDVVNAAVRPRAWSPHDVVAPPTERPSTEFRRWIRSILTTTQVTQNVILLALMYIYRLRKTAPAVRGRVGSEFRLMTVALMLGNKFLDDNTYTNKTWADVACMSVNEIHMMEVEFLNNIRYDLLVSAAQWEDWLDKLQNLYQYHQHLPRQTLSPTSKLSFASSPLGSPVLSAQQGLNSYAPTAPSYVGSNAWLPPATMPSSAPSAVAAAESFSGTSKKRSHLDTADPTEPPAKRLARPPQALAPTARPQPVPQRTMGNNGEMLRVSIPNLTLNTTGVPRTHVPAAASATQAAGPYLALGGAPTLASYPPLAPGVRAMSTVYSGPPSVPSSSTPPVSSGYPSVAPQRLPQTTLAGNMLSVSASTVGLPVPALYSAGGSVTGGGPVQPSGVVTPTAASNAVTPIHTLPTHSGYSTPTKRQSPSAAATLNAAFASSPLAADYFAGAGGSGIRTPISHSPMTYLQQRASPYKPVRGIRTLANGLSILPDWSRVERLPAAQMHYQHIGRPHELRQGILPEYNHHAYHHQHPPQPQQAQLSSAVPAQQQRGSQPHRISPQQGLEGYVGQPQSYGQQGLATDHMLQVHQRQQPQPNMTAVVHPMAAAGVAPLPPLQQQLQQVQARRLHHAQNQQA